MKVPRVHEILENTIQGEGSFAGYHASFLRLHGCPVGCWFCDTGYAAPDHGRKVKHEELFMTEILKRLKARHVVITGGEPLYRKDLPDIVARLLEEDKIVHLETSGIGKYLPPYDPNFYITLSPKEHLSKLRTNPEIWSRAHEIKLIIHTPEDLRFYADHLLDLPRKVPIFLQPEYSSRHEILPYLLQTLGTNPSWRLSTQTHKFLGLP